ncbi:type II secretion system protein [Thermohalobacter berrensis]|uniref:Prepilin-type N-terminal cleavage/methylation domain-containing protein n=1 Tax=Thermohalobacter berrensis TaxID=99594 RepID=A0A419TAU3_9FIRM|nr:type II secretion system protein [Thermohalobacter berrensis]RKD34585.1 hypothetical protein BET03_01800 [Thermohalobacter berrensis]
MKSNNCRGLTLIELIMVLGIIAIVFSLLFTLLISNIKVFNTSNEDIELQYQAQIAMDSIIDKAIKCTSIIEYNSKRLVFKTIDNSYEIFEIKSNNKIFYTNSSYKDASATLEIANYIESFDIKEKNNGIELTINLQNNKSIISEFYFRNKE